MTSIFDRNLPGNLLSTRLSQSLACVALVCISSIAIAQAGQLDPTFGTGGIFTSNFGGPALLWRGPGAIVQDNLRTAPARTR